MTEQNQPYFQRYGPSLWTLLVGLVFLPFVALSFYNHPTLDDGLDALSVKDMGFWAAQKFYYYSHTGRYTTTVLLALVNPLRYAHLEAHWWWVTLVFIAGTVAVLRLSLGRMLGVSAKVAWRGAAVVIALWLAFAPGQAEGLYWFTGAYTYIMAGWLLLLWLVALNRYLTAHQASQGVGNRLAVLAGLTVVLAGTVEPVVLPWLLVLASLTAVQWARSAPLRRAFTWLLALAAAGAAVSFLAPGNSVRMMSMGQHFGAVKTVLYAGGATAYLLLTWVANPVLLAATALALPALARWARKPSLLFSYVAAWPAGVLAVGLAALMAAASCPAYWASGTGLPLRARTLLYLFFLLGWFGVLAGWSVRQWRQERPSLVFATLAAGWLAPVWGVLLLGFFVADYNVQTRAAAVGQGSNNVIRAYQQWLGGAAARYDAEQRARYQALKSGQDVVTLRPLAARPALLVCFDIGDGSGPAVLAQYARYFGARRVVVRADSAGN